MSKNKAKRIFFNRWYYILIIFIFGIVSYFYNKPLGTTEILAALVLFLISYFAKGAERIKILKMFQQDILTAEMQSKSAIIHFPMPGAITNDEGKILWCNDEFAKIFDNDDLFGENLVELSANSAISEFLKSDELSMTKEIYIGNRQFNVAVSVSKNDKKKTFLFYFFETTKYADMQREYESKKVFECRLYIDNYDEMLQSTPQNSKPKLQSQLDEIISEWISENKGISVKYEKDKYFILFENRFLDDFINNKFEVINKVHEINEGNTLPVTISIGIGVGGDSSENNNYAKDAINMALGRGGDQAVIKDENEFRFYGGATKEYEKSTRVKARVVSFALNGLIDNAKDILIMGHRNADMDSVGAAFGIYRICKSHEKNVNIVMESYDQTVKQMLARLEDTDEYSGIFLSGAQALAKIDSQTLVIVVDTHKPSICDCPEVLDKTNHIVVIDHHRRGTEFIQNTELIYHEPYASSTSEMVTEILQYSPDKVGLNKIEAECLYAGILVDTKNFTFKTGVRTFEAASYLRKNGVDTIFIKKMFQQDLTSYVVKTDIIKNATVVHDNIAIGICPEKLRDDQLVIAQTADEFLCIKGITASFVLSFVDDDVISISGRSLGEINVQLILEKLGGGGHLTVAGAQLDGTNVEEATKMLIDAIDAYYEDTKE